MATSAPLLSPSSDPTKHSLVEEAQKQARGTDKETLQAKINMGSLRHRDDQKTLAQEPIKG